MPFGITRNPSLDIQPRLPVWIRLVDRLPRILAGGVPVVPFNSALRYRARHDGSTSGRPTLTSRERQAALLVVSGYTNRQIAGQRVVAEGGLVNAVRRFQI